MEIRERIIILCRGLIWWVDEEGKAKLSGNIAYKNTAEQTVNKMIDQLQKIFVEKQLSEDKR